MSRFDKILVALIDTNSKNIDFTDITGFLGCYTQDPDHPNYTDEFFMLFDENIHNDYTEEMHSRLQQSKMLKRWYTKRINNIPYCVYSFWLSPEVRKMFKDKVVYLNFDQKQIVQNYWSKFDKDVEDIVNSVLITVPIEDMPLEDYTASLWEQFQ